MEKIKKKKKKKKKTRRIIEIWFIQKNRCWRSSSSSLPLSLPLSLFLSHFLFLFLSRSSTGSWWNDGKINSKNCRCHRNYLNWRPSGNANDRIHIALWKSSWNYQRSSAGSSSTCIIVSWCIFPPDLFVFVSTSLDQSWPVSASLDQSWPVSAISTSLWP